MKPLLWLMALAVLFLASCSPNSGGANQTKISPRVVDEVGQEALPLALAYQVGDGAWNLLTEGNDGYVFYLPPGEKRYGVAALCPVFGEASGWGVGVIVQASSDETAAPLLTCPDYPIASVSISGQASVSAVTGARSALLAAGVSSRSRLATDYTYQYSLPKGGERDVVLLAYSVNSIIQHPDELLAGRIFRGLDARGDVQADLSLDDNDGVVQRQVQAFALPGGWSGGSFWVGLVSRGGVFTRGLLGEGDESGGVYRGIPNAAAGDYYLVSAHTSNETNGVRYTVKTDRYLPAADAGAVEVSLPQPLPADYSFDTSQPPYTFALSYPGEDLAAYRLYLDGVNNGPRWLVLATARWLRGRTNYTLPDFGGVPGFENLQRAFSGVRSWRVCALIGDQGLGALLAGPVYRGLPYSVPAALDLKQTCASSTSR